MFIRLFPVWAPLAALIGHFFAPIVAEGRSSIIPLLMLVMLSMGLTLKPKDFFAVGKYKSALFAGMLLQFTVMPLTALLLARLFGLNQELTIGLVLVGSVAGGTASNVMTYLANGNVALSVSMTAVSTLLSVFMTPFLLTVLVGSKVAVPAAAILISLFKIILIPVAIGVVLNTMANKWTVKIRPALAPLSVIAILVIIAIVVALNAERLATIGMVVVFATLIHNVTGLTLGYLAARALGFDSKICRTIAIEVGMQNSGLATALALKYFSPVAALPGAIFSIWLNITGSIFAFIFTRADRNYSGTV